jgi:DNA-binding MarR family transcriptional regulator
MYYSGMGRAATSDDDRLTTVGLLFESSAGLRRVFHRRLESERAITSQAFDVLIRLARTPGSELRMSELAAQTSLTPSGLTRSVDRLQGQGLVARRICPEDRRGAFAVLTPEGRALMDRAIPDHVAHVDEVLSDVFTPEEEETLAMLLRRLRDHLYVGNPEWDPSAEGADPCPGGAG